MISQAIQVSIEQSKKLQLTITGQTVAKISKNMLNLAKHVMANIVPEADIKPKDIFGIDTIVIGPAAKDSKYKYIQVIIDHHSRHVWGIPFD